MWLVRICATHISLRLKKIKRFTVQIHDGLCALSILRVTILVWLCALSMVRGMVCWFVCVLSILSVTTVVRVTKSVFVVSTVGFGLVLDMGVVETLKLLLWVVFIDCIGVGLLVSTLMWIVTNKYLLKHQNKDYDVEWGYAFDVHLNAFYPLLVILHFFQLFFINHIVVIGANWFPGYFVGNTLWLIAIGYYIYITFLGYSALPFLKNTVILLYPFALLGLLYILSISLGWNFTKGLCWFYKYRVQ